MTTSYAAISFAQVAPRYNAINAIPDEAAAALGRCLADAAAPGPALDMGCGAGRIALPTAAAGLSVIGIDLDGNMLREAHEHGAGLPFRALRGDISRLPFADNSFATVLSINVLHLVPAWQQVLQEAARVLQPGGRFIQGRDWIDPASPASQLRSRLRMIVGTLEPGLRPTAAASPQVMAETLTAMGGRTDADIVATSWQTPTAPAQLLREMAAREHNETWMLPDALLRAALERLSDWVGETYADAEQILPVERRFLLTVTHGLH